MKNKKTKQDDSPRWIDATRRRASSSDLLVNVTASGHIKGTPDTHAGSVQGPGSGFGHMTATVHFFVIDCVLIVVVGLESEFSAAYCAFEAARVEECEVLQRTHSIDLVDSLSASQTRAFVKVRPIHDEKGLERPSSFTCITDVFFSSTRFSGSLSRVVACCSLAQRSVSLLIRATLEIKDLDQRIEKLSLCQDKYKAIPAK